MSQANCSQAMAVARAVRSGEWEDSLRTHAGECAVCRDVVEASLWMQALADSSKENIPLPDAGLVWSRAQWSRTLRDRHAQAQRAQRVTEWIEIASVAIVSAGLAIWTIWEWQLFQAATDWVTTGLLQLSIATYEAAGSAQVSFGTTAAVLSLIVVLLAYPILADE